MSGIADWFVQMFVRHLRRLGPDQIRDLIKGAEEVDTLETLQAHLKAEDFMYWHGMMAMKDQLLEEIARKLIEMGVFSP